MMMPARLLLSATFTSLAQCRWMMYKQLSCCCDSRSHLLQRT